MKFLIFKRKIRYLSMNKHILLILFGAREME
jgi:hypothetical protein